MKDAIWLWEAKAFFELEKEKIKQDELKNDYEFKHKLMLYLHGVQEILFDLTCDHKNKYQRKEPLDRAELPIFREIVEELGLPGTGRPALSAGRFRPAQDECYIADPLLQP